MFVFAAMHESGIGPKQTLLIALHMSAFGGKADMTFCENPLLWSRLGLKRTCRFALQMSAPDPKRTSVAHSQCNFEPVRWLSRLGGK